MDIGDLKDAAESAEEIGEALKMCVPIAEQVADGLLAYGPALGKVVEGLRTYTVKRNLTSFKEYLAGGLTREEAMRLLISTQMAMAECVKGIGNSSTSTKKK